MARSAHADLDVELLLDCHDVIGESPTWSARDETLYWIDVKAPALHGMRSDGTREAWHLESDVGAFALTEDNGAVVALRTGLFRLALATGKTTRLAPSPFDPDMFRFNEGLCDAAGRFWIGVMYDPLPGKSSPDTEAALHCFTFADGLRAWSDRSDLHNGFAWSATGREFFWSHSNRRAAFRAAYDPGSGMLGSARPFFGLARRDALPDGAAMDIDECYWCAIHGAGALHRYDPTGALLASIDVPVSQPTMCAFVGPELDEMVVTTASDKLTADQLRQQPSAGGLFRLRPGVRGVPRPCIVR